ncbi:hypothetical protein QUF76_13370 [Desulfobacterales bacterium HSG16]|nr:hypothetical protein [Desulfobacterales bacterium HSG16]
MYRIRKFFISDIIAGENILQNGYFPIFRGEEQYADHGVVFAANGTCKTTLLSFLLTVFCPETAKFVQHLQSGGDKTLAQYLIPGRPAIVMLDLVTTLAPTLFNQEPVEHEVVGQLLYRHKSATGKLSRTYFKANNPEEFFISIQNNWREKLIADQPYTSVRDFILPQVDQTASQMEWKGKLEKLGLDPWLMGRQIDFARSEGGIKDAFKFRSETDFVSFFLSCVSDMNSAEQLRKNVVQSIKKMKDRPAKNEQLTAARNLKQRIIDFDELAVTWRNAAQNADMCRIQLGEAAHLIQDAEKKAGERLEEVSRVLKEEKGERGKEQQLLEIAQVNLIRIEQAGFMLTIQSFMEKNQNAALAITKETKEQNGLDAADLMARLRHVRAEAGDKESALSQADSKIDPVREMVNIRAAQYHKRLDHDKTRLKTQIASFDKEQEKITVVLNDSKTQIAGLGRELSRTTSEIANLNGRIDSAIEARKALPLKPGENPEDGVNRMKKEIFEHESRIEKIEKQIQELDKLINDENKKLENQKTDRLETGQHIKEAIIKKDDEAKQREKILADKNIQIVAGASDFEPSHADLSSRMDESIARMKIRFEEKQIEKLKIEAKLAGLAEIDSLAVDQQVKELIAHYTAQGISASTLKAFPEYLSSLYSEEPERIGRFMEKDPGRFTGIMAANEKIIEKICNLPVPEWLHKPVIISKACTIDEVKTTEHNVIAPPDPNVYSKGHIEEFKTELRQNINALEDEITIHEKNLKSYAASGRTLHDYRNLWPDRTAVDAVSERVTALQQKQKNTQTGIFESEEMIKTLSIQKKGLEDEDFRKTSEITRFKHHIEQISAWIRQYGGMDQWRKQQEEKEAVQRNLEKKLSGLEESVKKWDKKARDIEGMKGKKTSELRGLQERAVEVPFTGDFALSADLARKALTIELFDLRQLHTTALDTERRKTDELGIGNLKRELERLEQDAQELSIELDRFAASHPFDSKMAEQWSSENKREREEQREHLSKSIDRNRNIKAEAEAEIKVHKRDLSERTEKLAEKAAQGIIPDILPGILPGNLTEMEADQIEAIQMEDCGITTENLEDLMHSVKAETLRMQEEIKRLTERVRDLEKQLHGIALWHGKIRLTAAAVGTVEPVWDDLSPRDDWPDIFDTENRLQAAEKMYDKISEQMQSLTETEKDMENSRRRMHNGFDTLQNRLREDAIKKNLPAIIDEIAQYDAESLGNQSRELVEKCEQVAVNIESDLERSGKIVKNIVDQLYQHGMEYHNRIQTASRITIPEKVFIYGKKKILHAGSRLDFNKQDEIFRQAIENWLDELIQQNRVPEASVKKGNRLGSEILYRLLRATGPKTEFGIRLLKCDDTGKNYEPVGKDFGSGGEALTTAVLLYSLLTSMRQKRRHNPEDRIPAFLILDNPLGVCNRSDFLDAQLKVARSMGIQCVYLTGINDRESLGLFEHRVAIRKSGRRINVDGKAYESLGTYDTLEIIEQNVERSVQ